MKNEIFAELLDSAHEAVEHAQGKRRLRATTLPIPVRTARRVASRRAAGVLLTGWPGRWFHHQGRRCRCHRWRQP